jgi:hypothetical protein
VLINWNEIPFMPEVISGQEDNSTFMIFKISLEGDNNVV